jgi:hypothetical protein
MFCLMLFGISLGVQFHLYHGWGYHIFTFCGARQSSLELGALTLSVVRAV